MQVQAGFTFYHKRRHLGAFQGERAPHGESALTEEGLRYVSGTLHEHDRPRGIQINNARLLMELRGRNLTMLPERGDILSLGADTNLLLYHLRESHVRWVHRAVCRV